MRSPALLRAVLLLAAAAAPAAADDPAARLYAKTCLAPPYLLNPAEKDVQEHLRCSGKGESFCLELRAAYVGKRLPKLASGDVESACGGRDARGSVRWLELRDAIAALVRGHSYTPAEREEVEKTIRGINLVYQRPGGPGKAELEALRRYYLNKAFVLSAEQDQEHRKTAETLLKALEERLPKVAAGTLTQEELKEWARYVEFVEAYIITPGSGLPGREDFLKKFDEVAAFYDVHEYLVRRAAEKLAAPREEHFKDGKLTETGRAAAAELARGRRKLRALAHLDIAEGMTRAPDTERGDWKEQSDKTQAAAERTAEALRDDERLKLLGEFERSDFARRRDDAAPPAPHKRMDPKSFPDEFPQYFVRAAPDRAALIYRFSESHYARLGTKRPPEMTGLSGRLTAARRELYHYLVDKECPKFREAGREACEQAQRGRADGLVDGADPFQKGVTELAKLASERQRREELWDGVKHFIPGYDCYALYANWSKSTGGDKALEASMCVFGALPLVRATARLGQTALSKTTRAGERAVAPKTPAGKIPPVDAVARNAALAQREERVVETMRQMGLTRRQAEAVAEAHEREGLRCAVYRCTKEQLEGKLRVMTADGLMTAQQAKEAIRRGLAGEPAKVGETVAIPRSRGGLSNAEVVSVDAQRGTVSVTFTDELGRTATKRVSIDELRHPLADGLPHIKAGQTVGWERLGAARVDAEIVAIDDVRVTLRYTGADGVARVETGRIWELRPPAGKPGPGKDVAPAPARGPPVVPGPEAEALRMLERQGVSLRHGVEHDGFKLTFSDFFTDSGGRVFAVARVERGGQVTHRVVYRSNSSAVFRYMPAYRTDGWYDKGYKLGEAALALPPKLQEFLGKLSTRGPPIEPESLRGLLPVVSVKDYYGQLVHDPGYVGKVLRRQDDLLAKVPRSLDTVDKERKLAHPSLVQAERAGAKPDFSRQVQTYSFETPVYGPVRAEVYASKDGTLLYSLLKDAQGRVWFGDVRLAESRINSHVVGQNWVESGELITPLWEYMEQLPAAFLGPKHPSKGYFLAWSYIRQFPDIRRYYAERGLSVPP